MKAQPRITVGELIRELSLHDKDCIIDFSGLDYYRVKQRSPQIVQIEFDQQVYRDDQGNVVVENL